MQYKYSYIVCLVTHAVRPVSYNYNNTLATIEITIKTDQYIQLQLHISITACIQPKLGAQCHKELEQSI